MAENMTTPLIYSLQATKRTYLADISFLNLMPCNLCDKRLNEGDYIYIYILFLSQLRLQSPLARLRDPSCEREEGERATAKKTLPKHVVLTSLQAGPTISVEKVALAFL
jgi:hypothetical protein